MKTGESVTRLDRETCHLQLVQVRVRRGQIIQNRLLYDVFLCTSQASLTVRIIFPRYEIENGLSEGVFLCTQNAFAALWVCFWTQYLIKMHSLTPNADQ